jgi:hypothetical protein
LCHFFPEIVKKKKIVKALIIKIRLLDLLVGWQGSFSVFDVIEVSLPKVNTKDFHKTSLEKLLDTFKVPRTNLDRNKLAQLLEKQVSSYFTFVSLFVPHVQCNFSKIFH